MHRHVLFLSGLLIAPASATQPLDTPVRLRLDGSQVTLSLPEAGTLELRAVDISGRQHGPSLRESFSAGIHVFPSPWGRPARPLWVEIRLPSGKFLRSLPQGTLILSPGRAEGMRRIPAGTFLMGSPYDESGRYDDEVPHSVTLGSFWIDTVETTRQAFGSLMGYVPDDSLCQEVTCPVTHVNWFEALLYCNARSRSQGRDSSYAYSRVWRDSLGRAIDFDELALRPQADGYRLPSEAQWERAARAGSEAAWPWGGDSLPSSSFAWSLVDADSTPHPVGHLGRDAWGLHDMTGNVNEWTWDWYGAYDTLATLDPSGPTQGLYRVYRGGDWRSSVTGLRTAFRNGGSPLTRNSRVGLRCIRPAATQE